MLARNPGAVHNASRLAAGLKVSSQTVGHYTDLLVNLLLVRRLEPCHTNVGKRQVKSHKVWERFLIENLNNDGHALTVPGFYRTSDDAEIDLLLKLPADEVLSTC